ncbi:MAG: hypothetical protein CL691_00095 [Cellvibrionales bacterium]|nr:hypothetical protein [Cellvibrionales bacterium]|tara:strand:+ start:4418 stop:5242 length:825 start_codon:yes stop_codon:yes gene_type:complete
MSGPDFLCIGAQKSGTTWLDNVLRASESVWLPPIKELQFFNELFMPSSFTWTNEHRKSNAEIILKNNAGKKEVWLDLVRHIGFEKISYDWYEHIFSYANKMVCGEITPEYSLLSAKHVTEIKNSYPNLKIIFIIREPYSRALSNIKMRMLQKGLGDDSDPKEIKTFISNAVNDWDLTERGNYEKIISAWSKVFGEDKCLFILLADIYSAPVEIVKHVAEFLNTEIDVTSINLGSKVHVGREVFIDEEDKNLIRLSQEKNILWFNNNYKDFEIKL